MCGFVCLFWFGFGLIFHYFLRFNWYFNYISQTLYLCPSLCSLSVLLQSLHTSFHKPLHVMSDFCQSRFCCEIIASYVRAPPLFRFVLNIWCNEHVNLVNNFAIQVGHYQVCLTGVTRLNFLKYSISMHFDFALLWPRVEIHIYDYDGKKTMRNQEVEYECKN